MQRIPWYFSPSSRYHSTLMLGLTSSAPLKANNRLRRLFSGAGLTNLGEPFVYSNTPGTPRPGSKSKICAHRRAGLHMRSISLTHSASETQLTRLTLYSGPLTAFFFTMMPSRTTLRTKLASRYASLARFFPLIGPFPHGAGDGSILDAATDRHRTASYKTARSFAILGSRARED